MSKHTPGPTDGLIIRATDLQQAIEALHNGDLEALDSQLEGLAECAPLCIRREATAAPELLTALRRLVEVLECDQCAEVRGWKQYDNARTAIAKAQPIT